MSVTRLWQLTTEQDTSSPLISPPNKRGFFYNLYTIWLFTASDIKTIIVPCTSFAIVSDLATSSYASESGLAELSSLLLKKTPQVVFWTWINLLPITIDNQRRPESIQEDAFNKPWRPLPSHRLRPDEAKRVMMGLYALSFLISARMGAHLQCIALMLLGWWYNNARGADRNPIIRNVINGLAYLCFTSGGFQVSITSGNESSFRTLDGKVPGEGMAWWFLCIFLVISTSMHSQDMGDQEGDAARNRKTIPLVIGDTAARFSIAIPVCFWSLACPWAWSCSAPGYIPSALIGAVVAYRTLYLKSVSADKRTYQIWNVWLSSVFFIPLIKSVQGR